jgi:hypothetical protein
LTTQNNFFKHALSDCSIKHAQGAALLERHPSQFSTALHNWLSIGHPEAGERSAVIYTLLGSCRRHGLNPFDYLNDLFTRLPAAKITEIGQFTPAAWAGSCQT